MICQTCKFFEKNGANTAHKYCTNSKIPPHTGLEPIFYAVLKCNQKFHEPILSTPASNNRPA
jgi:hypothetical protein